MMKILIGVPMSTQHHTMLVHTPAFWPCALSVLASSAVTTATAAIPHRAYAEARNKSVNNDPWAGRRCVPIDVHKLLVTLSTSAAHTDGDISVTFAEADFSYPATPTEWPLTVPPFITRPAAASRHYPGGPTPFGPDDGQTRPHSGHAPGEVTGRPPGLPSICLVADS